MEQPIVSQGVAIGDGLEVAEDLSTQGVTLARDVVEFLEHGHVDVRLDVAHDAGIAVPVPGTPHAPRLIDDPDALDPGFTEAYSGEDPGDSPAYDDRSDVVGQRLPLDERRERIGEESGEVLITPKVADLCPVRDEPPVTFSEVLGPNGLGVVARGRIDT